MIPKELTLRSHPRLGCRYHSLRRVPFLEPFTTTVLGTHKHLRKRNGWSNFATSPLPREFEISNLIFFTFCDSKHLIHYISFDFTFAFRLFLRPFCLSPSYLSYLPFAFLLLKMWQAQHFYISIHFSSVQFSLYYFIPFYFILLYFILFYFIIYLIFYKILI